MRSLRSDMTPSYVYRAKLNRVVDGDTYEMDVDLGFDVWKRSSIRVRGLFIAEKNTPEGQEAKRVVTELFANAKVVVISTQKDKRGGDVQTFARYVADVWLDGVLLSEVMTKLFPPGGVGVK